MRNTISIILAMVIAITTLTVGLSTASAASTSVNGKTAVKGGIMTVSYTLKAPEKMEDIQAIVTYSKGLKLMSVSYSKKMQTGSFIHNENLKNELRFNSICINDPMDFKKKATLVTMKFKVLSTGRQATSLNLQCLDSVTNKGYGKNQSTTNYKKLSISTVNKIYVYSVKLNKTKITLKKGRKYQLKASVTPSSASKSFKWTTSKKKVATVSSKGKITAKKKGTCYIICTANDGSKKYKKCKVTVK